MSDIREMNGSIREWAAGGAIVVALATATGIAPEAIINLAHGEATRKLAWGVLIPVFGGLALLVEATQLGRSTPHRKQVNSQIVREILEASCPNVDCPEKAKADAKTNANVMAAFYAQVDQPSREVAFHQWGWYYTAVLWIWFSVIGLLGVLLTWPFISTGHTLIRVAAAVFLLVMIVIAWFVRKTWAQKTLNLAASQVTQINDQIGKSLGTPACSHASCPLK